MNYDVILVWEDREGLLQTERVPYLFDGPPESAGDACAAEYERNHSPIKFKWALVTTRRNTPGLSRCYPNQELTL